MTEEVRAAKAATKAAARAAARAEGSKVVRKAESRAKMAVARGAFARPAAAQAFDERDWFCQPLDEAMSFYSTFLDDISSDVLTPDGAISFDQDACSFSMESIRAHNSEPCHDLDAEVDVETRSILVQPSESRTEEDGGEGKGKVHFGGQGGTTLSQSRHWFARSGAGRMAVVAKALERGRGCVSALSRISKLVRKR